MRKIVLVGIVLLISFALIGQAIANDEGSGGSSTSPADKNTNASVGGNVSIGASEVSTPGMGTGLGWGPGISSRAGGIFGRVGKVGGFSPGFAGQGFDWNRLYQPVAGYNYYSYRPVPVPAVSTIQNGTPNQTNVKC